MEVMEPHPEIFLSTQFGPFCAIMHQWPSETEPSQNRLIPNLGYCFLITLSPSGLLRDNCLIKAVMSLESLKEPTF